MAKYTIEINDDDLSRFVTVNGYIPGDAKVEAALLKRLINEGLLADVGVLCSEVVVMKA